MGRRYVEASVVALAGRCSGSRILPTFVDTRYHCGSIHEGVAESPLGQPSP